MTSQELIDNGWRPEECRVGTLYFKDRFFCHLKGDRVKVFSKDDDMNCIGEAKTFDEIEEIEKEFLQNEIRIVEAALLMLKLQYKERFGENV